MEEEKLLSKISVLENQRNSFLNQLTDLNADLLMAGQQLGKAMQEISNLNDRIAELEEKLSDKYFAESSGDEPDTKEGTKENGSI